MSDKKTNLNKQLTYLQKRHFTGCLKVASNTGKKWILYFCLSRLVWADGGEHPNRSWHRHLAKYCPQVDFSSNMISEVEKFECWNYHLLTVLLKRGKIKREQVTGLIKSKVIEVLFDIIQEEAIEPLDYNSQAASADFLLASGLKMSLGPVTIEQALDRAQQAWFVWCQKNLKGWSPNLAPILVQPELLQQKFSTTVYQNFFNLLDGKRTLRDLTQEMDPDVEEFTYSLVPYIDGGFLELVEVPDISLKKISDNSEDTSSPSGESSARRKPLVACIDDSPQICKIMETIITKEGYRFISIQQALQAIPKLIKCNPDLIFLDIGMPIVNGYEICAQVRRVSKLKDIPIVILTGNDRLVDRMRAKVVGASDFLSKPIDIEKIINIIEKYVSVANGESISETSIPQSKKTSKLNLARSMPRIAPNQ